MNVHFPLLQKAIDKFFAAVYAAVLRHLPFQTLRAIVIASPGFTRDSVSPPPRPLSPHLAHLEKITAVRLHLPTSHSDDEQTSPPIPDQVGQGT